MEVETIIIKQRHKPDLLTALELLDRRMTLPYREKQHLSTLSKGFQGEMLFDSLMESYLNSEQYLVLNDLSLVIGNTSIQIDSLIITSDTILLYEIKNYEGNYTDQTSQFRTEYGQDIVSPADQLKRTTTVFKKLVNQWDSTFPIVSHVLFINNHFFLYEAKKDSPFLFLPQLNGHFTSINRKSFPLTARHHHLADRLLNECEKELPYQRKLPYYAFKDLKKGLSCSSCGSFDLKNSTKVSHCTSCGYTISLNAQILAEVRSFTFLFPKEQLTCNVMYEWCGGAFSKRRIRAALSTTYTVEGFAKSSHYVKMLEEGNDLSR
ncbi:MAG: NERD domain-containing protein [Alkalibacterium sp.]|nr:NERD domain-containing protein [Alkalibacterium sp.]